jgi:hypothetical protein
MYDLALVRERSPALGRSWTVLHKIDWETHRFGKRHLDLLSEKPDGRLQMDCAKFHDLVDAKL